MQVHRLVYVSAALIGCTGSIATTPDGVPPATMGDPGVSKATSAQCLSAAPSPGPAFVRRLTRWEYLNTITDVLKVTPNPDMAAMVPLDLRANGFSNNATTVLSTFSQVDSYAKAAEAVADSLIKTPTWVGQFAPCSDTGASCRDQVVRAVGLRLFRRPLKADELASFGKLFDAGVAEGMTTASEATALVVRAMLQSPQFLYRLESQVPTGDAKVRLLDGYEVATRLSYFVWGSAPDQELLTAAGQGQLDTPEKVGTQLTRMMGMPRARESATRYFQQWLSLDDLDDANRGPAFTAELAADMKRETLDVVGDMLWDKKQPLMSMYETKSTIVSPALAKFYGLNGAGGPTSLENVPNRVGLLTHASVLTVNGDALAGLVDRGTYIMRNVLCQDVPQPPPGATSVKVAPETATEREKSEARRAAASCGVCHSLFDQLAYGFENYDATGAWRDSDEQGRPLKQDGALLVRGADGKLESALPYKNVQEYMALLAKDKQALACATQKVTQFAWGRPMSEGDQCLLEDVGNRLRESKGQTFPDLVAAIATSPAFRFTAVE